MFAGIFFQTHSRACLKNHSRNLHAPLCGIFCPNSVAVARYGALIWTKSPTNCDAHLAESLFQTHSSLLVADRKADKGLNNLIYIKRDFCAKIVMKNVIKLRIKAQKT